jgi:MOSC domain-containing protein YiiM
MDGPVEGRAVSLHLSVASRQPMKTVDSVTFVAGRGIEGDRHASSVEARQVLMMDEETLRLMGLDHAAIKENVTSSGIDVASLAPGQQLALGDEVLLRVSMACAPCSRMDDIRPGLQQELEGRRGKLASVVQGGVVRVGDPIRLV